MKFSLPVVLFHLLFTANCLGEPVRWLRSDGGNGHYYEHFLPNRGITWTDANKAAKESQFLGINGHLVAVSSESEWDFITKTFLHSGTWIGLSDWIVEGEFVWENEEAFEFSAWHRNEPNNAGNEDYVYYSLGDEGWGWNDFRDQRDQHSAKYPLGYLIEYPVNRLSGDFDGDDLLTAADIDSLSLEVAIGTHDPQFDLDGNGLVNHQDRDVWTRDLIGTYYGDANLDGEFNTGDFVSVFDAGEYEDGILLNSTWATGDWNGDREFDTRDFLIAFREGGFELGPRVDLVSVAEPVTISILQILLLCVVCRFMAATNRICCGNCR